MPLKKNAQNNDKLYKAPPLLEGGLYLYDGPPQSAKSSILLKALAELLCNVPSHRILVLSSSHSRQNSLKQRLLREYTKPFGTVPIYTFNGWVRNTLFEHWPAVEWLLHKQESSYEHGVLKPTLSGFDTTEFLLSQLYQELARQQPDWLAGLELAPKPLMRQIIRRMRLRSENRLNRDTFRERDAWLGLSHHTALAWLEDQADRLSYRSRCLDAAKQLDVFWGLLEKAPSAQAWLKERSQYVLVDDVDESTAAQQAFIDWCQQHTKSMLLTGDSEGGARQGYLGGHPDGWKQQLEKAKAEQVVYLGKVLNPSVSEQKTEKQALLEILSHNWLQADEGTMKPLRGDFLQVEKKAITWVAQLDQVFVSLQQALNQGQAPHNYVWVLPSANTLPLEALCARLERHNIPYQVLSGTERPAHNPHCRGLLYGLLLLNSKADQQVSGRLLSLLEWRSLLQLMTKRPTEGTSSLTMLSLSAIEALAQALQSGWAPGHAETGADRTNSDPKNTILFPHPFEALPLHLEPAQEGERIALQELYEAMARLFNSLIDKDPLQQAYGLLEQWLRPQWNLQSASGSLTAVLLNSLEQHIALMNRLGMDTALGLREWARQALWGSVANTPETPPAIDPKALLIATPQKLIDAEVSRPEQWWLDCGAADWCRLSDAAPLYHAWVMSAAFHPEALSSEALPAFNDRRARLQTLAQLRKLIPLAEKRIRCFASELDWEGLSQPARLLKRLPQVADTHCSPADYEPEIAPRPTLREDQAPALTYKLGTMAINAVPGAGKTFINVQLIRHLIENGLPAPQLLVLTFMESAARTLQARVQTLLGASQAEPTITTIHGLAYKLLNEGDYAQRVGLQPGSWQIADEAAAEQALRFAAQSTYNLVLTNEPNLEPDEWLRTLRRAIGQAKNLRLSYQPLAEALSGKLEASLPQAFVLGWQTYQETLARQQQLDFTDLILKAITLLEEHADCRKQCQQQFQVILEDEAQDSSPLLQKLLELLAGDEPNLIRTGDSNQSITTTFSAAHPEDFLAFSKRAQLQVAMTHSGRCASPIIGLANRWLYEAGQHEPDLSHAFVPLKMQAVAGHNPDLLTAVEALAFTDQRHEQEWLCEQVQAMHRRFSETSKAILARSNQEVLRIAQVLQEAGLQAIAHQDSLGQSPVFRVLTRYLACLTNPLDASTRLALLDSLVQANCEGFTDTDTVTLAEARVLLGASPIFSEGVSAIASFEILIRLYYDWLDFSRDTLSPAIDSLLVRITDRLFSGVADRSNGYLAALYAQQLLQQHSNSSDHPAQAPIELVAHGFKQMERRQRGLKAFTHESVATSGENPHTQESGKAFVHVMTLHKAKGQEFDLVWMPGLTQAQFPSQCKHIKPRLEDRLLLWINRQASNASANEAESLASHVPTTLEAMARKQVEEEARLIYVGLTRAKKGLFLSYPEQTPLKNGKLRPQKPSLAFTLLSQWLATPEQQTEKADAPLSEAVVAHG